MSALPHTSQAAIGTGSNAMEEEKGIRPGEIVAELPASHDAGVWFIGTVRTPWTRLADCPKRGDIDDGPVCRIEIDPRWRLALKGIEEKERVQVLYWMHRARRDLVVQTPSHLGRPVGTFAVRSPARPNPIASAVVALVGVEGDTLLVRGLDCLDGTPVVDIKPDHRLQR